MSFVLAIEPDDTQARLLRGLVSGPGIELVLVMSPSAAIDSINQRVPDLVLLSEALGARNKPVLDRLKSIPGTVKVQTLPIPSFATNDPEAFAAEVTLSLLRTTELARKQEAQANAIAPEVHEAHIALLQADAEARLATELERVRREAAEQRVVELARLEAEAEVRRRADVAAARAAAAEEARSVLTSELAGIRGEAEHLLASELERVRNEAAQKLAAQLEEADAQRSAAVEQARLAAEHAASQALEAEVARIKVETDARLAAELQRVHGEAQQARADEQHTRQEAEAALAAEVARVQRESEARLEAELARARAEADEARRAQEEARVDLEAVRYAARDAQIAAGQAAARELEAEVARIKAETDGRLEAELRRVHDEAQQARAAEQQTRQDAEAALAAEVARVRQESEAQLAAEVARARAEAEEALHAQQAVQVDLEEIRDAAAREARAAGEEAAARALEAEAERLRAEAEARLQEELARIRAEAEHVRHEHEQAQLEAEAAREAAVREAREIAIREAREAAVQEARAAAEATAIRRVDAEVARVRAEAELRFRGELEKRQQQVELERAAGQSQAEQVRQEVEREARQRADEVLRVEILRARADAEARLATEIAEVQAEAERRREAELAEIRNQLAHANAMAREHARVAAKGAVSAEVARAEIEMPGAAARAARTGSHAALATFRAAGLAVRGMGRIRRAAVPVIRDLWERVPEQTLPFAAALVVVAAGFAYVDVPLLTQRAISYANSVVSRGSSEQGPAPESDPGSAPGPEGGSDPVPGQGSDPGADPLAQAPGTLTVFSRVPLDLYISGTRVGSTDDGQIILPPGSYRVELVSERLGYRGAVSLKVGAAAVTSHTVTLPNGRLQVNTEPGAQVSIEGQRVGVAPLGPLPVQIGTREVVVTHPDLGERREFVEVRFGVVTDLTVARREAIDPSKAYPLPDLSQPSAPIR